MPDKVRSVDEMVADMKKAVEEPAGSGSSAKHRQHVAQAIEKLITSQIVDCIKDVMMMNGAGVVVIQNSVNSLETLRHTLHT